jgi:Phasin protein
MVKNIEDMQQFGKDNMDATMKSFGSLSKSMQAIAVEVADYSKKMFENSTAATEKLIGAKSLEKAVEVQTTSRARTRASSRKPPSLVSSMRTWRERSTSRSRASLARLSRRSNVGATSGGMTRPGWCSRALSYPASAIRHSCPPSREPFAAT